MPLSTLSSSHFVETLFIPQSLFGGWHQKNELGLEILTWSGDLEYEMLRNALEAGSRDGAE